MPSSNCNHDRYDYSGTNSYDQLCWPILHNYCFCSGSDINRNRCLYTRNIQCIAFWFVNRSFDRSHHPKCKYCGYLHYYLHDTCIRRMCSYTCYNISYHYSATYSEFIICRNTFL